MDHDGEWERMQTGNAQTMIFGVAEMCQKVIMAVPGEARAMVYENRFQAGRPCRYGGASGIGLSVAARLAREGAAVSLWDLKDDALAGPEAERRHIRRPSTSCDPRPSPPRHVGERRRLGGKLDLLVASAKHSGPNTPVRDYPVEAWRQVIDVNQRRVLQSGCRPRT